MPGMFNAVVRHRERDKQAYVDALEELRLGVAHAYNKARQLQFTEQRRELLASKIRPSADNCPVLVQLVAPGHTIPSQTARGVQIKHVPALLPEDFQLIRSIFKQHGVPDKDIPTLARLGTRVEIGSFPAGTRAVCIDLVSTSNLALVNSITGLARSKSFDALYTEFLRRRNSYRLHQQYDPTTAEKLGSETDATPASEEIKDTTEPAVYVDRIQTMHPYGWDSPDLAVDADRFADYVEYREKVPFAEKGGIGPGEKHLAKLFGGTYQGTSVSYDLYLPTSNGAGAKFEVKSVGVKSEEIRPGTNGRREYQAVKSKLDSVLHQLRRFAELVERTQQIKHIFSQGDLRHLYANIVHFLNASYSKIITGEVSRARLTLVLSILKSIAQKRRDYNVGTAPVLSVSYGNQKGEITRRTHEKIIVTMLMAAHEGEDIGIEFDPIDIAFSLLGGSMAFDDPDRFIKEFYDVVRPEDVFDEVDGLIITNERWFYVIPKSEFSRPVTVDGRETTVLAVESISQGVPRFSFNPPPGTSPWTTDGLAAPQKPRGRPPKTKQPEVDPTVTPES